MESKKQENNYCTGSRSPRLLATDINEKEANTSDLFKVWIPFSCYEALKKYKTMNSLKIAQYIMSKIIRNPTHLGFSS